MPENDLRQTIMLHESEEELFTDPWRLADYGDGWGCYGILRDEQDLAEALSQLPRLRRSLRRV